jgi:uncharacterized protein (TIGR02466 family)
MVGDPATLLQELIRRARGLMQQGNWQAAETELRNGLESHADAAKVLSLLGTLYHLTSRHGEAIDLLCRALEREPGDVRSRLNLGAALLADGRLADAQSAFSAVLAEHPGMEDAHLNLGLVLQRQGQMLAAAEQFEAVLQNNPDAQDARLSLALARLSMGNFHEALTAAEKLLHDPASVPAARAVQSKSLLGLGRVEQAFSIASAAVAAHPKHSVLRSALGDALTARGQLGEAVGTYEAALAQGDGRLGTRLSLAQCLLESGLYARAVLVLEGEGAAPCASGHRGGTDETHRWQLLGDALVADGLYARALEAYDKASTNQPQNAALLCRVAQAQFALGHNDDAEHSLQRAAVAEPGASEPCVLAIENSIASGRLEDALALCQRYTDDGFVAHEVLAAEAFLLNALGYTREAQHLAGFEQLVTTQVLTPPSTFSSLAEFNMALARGLRAHPSLTAEGAVSKATQNGQQSGNLLSTVDGVFADFEALLWSAVERYLDTLPVDDTHPYLHVRPELTGVHCWGVVLKRAGYQAPHIHPTGWVSGVYYPELPESLGSDRTHEGWLEFGLPPESLATGVTLSGRRIKPEEGLLVLFPSYLYHSTVPFAADVERVSLAFDFTYAAA